MDIKNLLQGHYRDMQDMEFTIEEKKVYMLQTRCVCVLVRVAAVQGSESAPPCSRLCDVALSCCVGAPLGMASVPPSRR